MALHFINVTEQESIIEVFGAIGEGWEGEGKNTAVCISEELARIKALKAKAITVKINSLGGDVNHALAIFDLLQEHDAQITTQIIGLCASAATVIAAAGTTRQMSRNALFLIHQCSSYIGRANEMQLAAEMESQQTINKRILSIYTQNCDGNCAQEIETLFVANAGQGKWIEASEALRLGFVTDVYNDKKKAACISKKSFENSLLPALPQQFADFLTEDTGDDTAPDAPATAQTPGMGLIESLKNLFSKNTNKNQALMKNLFPFICLAASLTDETYAKEKGVTFTDVQLSAIEKTLKEFSDLKAQFETLKTEKQNALSSNSTLQKQYNDLKVIVDALPGVTTKVDGNDPHADTAETFSDWQKKNKYYQEISDTL